MRLFDLHNDTPLKLYFDRLSFRDPRLHVSWEDLAHFEATAQVFAYFCRPSLSDDEAFDAFFRAAAHVRSALSPYRSERHRFYLAVEDARLIGTSPERIRLLFSAGVRILTPVWRGVTQIGGAYDTAVGLTKLGRTAVAEALRLGIHPDVSHASPASFSDIAEAAAAHRRPLIATHSNSYAVHPHPRNLRDREFRTIRDMGGLVGLCLCPDHLTDGHEAGMSHVIRHLEHWLALGGEETVALGTDLDGIEKTPADLRRCRDLSRLADELSRIGYSDTLIEKIFWNNAEEFFGKYNKRQDTL